MNDPDAGRGGHGSQGSQGTHGQSGHNGHSGTHGTHGTQGSQAVRGVLSAFPELHTARLRLREIRPSDSEALYAIHSDADWMRWYGVDPLVDPSQASQLADLFAGWFHAGTGFRWALERRSDRQLIGTCGLFRWNRSWRNCVVGYEIARQCQRQGYMLEALDAVLDFGFTAMHLHRIQAETHPDNAPSIALAQRIGFRFEGIHREQAYWGGRFHDLNCYSILEQDWRKRNAAREN